MVMFDVASLQQAFRDTFEPSSKPASLPASQKAATGEEAKVQSPYPTWATRTYYDTLVFDLTVPPLAVCETVLYLPHPRQKTAHLGI